MSSTAEDENINGVYEEEVTESPVTQTPACLVASALPGPILTHREPLSPRSGNGQVEEEVVRTARKKRGGLRRANSAAPIENE